MGFIDCIPITKRKAILSTCSTQTYQNAYYIYRPYIMSFDIMKVIKAQN